MSEEKSPDDHDFFGYVVAASLVAIGLMLGAAWLLR